jgi:hypothetical protein
MNGGIKMEAEVCPGCISDETYQLQDWLGKELRYCENCEIEYEVTYKLELKEKKIKHKKVDIS